MESNVTPMPVHGMPAVPDTGTLKGFLRFLWQELKPRGKVLTPFNIITGILILGGIVIIAASVKGLGTVSNVYQEFPWGLWKGLNVVTGVAFAGGAYVLTFLVYVLRIEKYHSIVRATVLNGFLAYCFYAGALVLDLGQPWHILNPIIGNSFGLTSVLFLVAWHFMLYMLAQLVEFSPAVAEWLGTRRVHRILSGLTVGAVVSGITLSTLHQSALGALYVMAQSKIHPLWYFEQHPGALLRVQHLRGVFDDHHREHVHAQDFLRPARRGAHRASHNKILLGLAKGSASVMAAYLFLKVIDLTHGTYQLGSLTPMGSGTSSRSPGSPCSPSSSTSSPSRGKAQGSSR